MKLPLRTALLAAGLALRLAAADAPTPAAPASPADEQKILEQAILERLADHALKKGEKAAPVGATDKAAPAPVSGVPDAPATDPTMLLPRVEVNQSRITQQAILEHQKDREIALEKKNTTPTPVDSALNDPGVSHVLGVLGGSSSDDRARLAQERVSLLETERDLLDEIARAPTNEERDALQRQLNDLRTMRRELEHEPRKTLRE